LNAVFGMMLYGCIVNSYGQRLSSAYAYENGLIIISLVVASGVDWNWSINRNL